MLKEIVHLLRKIEDDGDGENQHDREKERTEELPDYIPIESFQMSNVQSTISSLNPASRRLSMRRSLRRGSETKPLFAASEQGRPGRDQDKGADALCNPGKQHPKGFA